MPNYRYKAITQAGEIVTGEIAAPTAAEVARRIEYLGLVPVDTVTEERAEGASRFFTLTQRAKAEDVTVFTLDLALLLKAGARLDDALELLSVLPQFASVLRDFNAKLDPVVLIFISMSEFLRANGTVLAVALALIVAAFWLMLRRPASRATIVTQLSRLPLIKPILTYHRTTLFCRNLGVLLASAVPLTTTLRILVDMMATTSDRTVWTRMVERVRHGGKLSDALTDTAALPMMAVRMLRLGEETGQLPMLAGRVAEFYEAKLQRSLDRIVGIAGPAAIITISIIVGGLIVSVMTSLLSVSQIIG